MTHRDAVSTIKRQLHFPRPTSKQDSKFTDELQLVPSATLKSIRQGLIVKQRNLGPGNMQGPVINAPLNPSTYLSDPLVIANETKTKEVQFNAYLK